MVKDSWWILILLIMERIIDGYNSDNLAHVLFNFLLINWKFYNENIDNHLVSFSLYGGSVF
jgi:hypothetical protein